MVGRLFRSIKRKPRAVRDQYALGIAVAVTSVVIVLWVWQLPERFDETAADVTVPADVGAFGGLLGEFKDRLSTVRDDIDAVVATSTPQADIVVATSTLSSTSATTTSITTASSTPPVPVGRPIRIATTSASTTAQ